MIPAGRRDQRPDFPSLDFRIGGPVACIEEIGQPPPFNEHVEPALGREAWFVDAIICRNGKAQALGQ
jgi:hypothetical protein